MRIKNTLTSMLSTCEQEGSQYNSHPTRMRGERCTVHEDLYALFFGPGENDDSGFINDYVNSRTQFWWVDLGTIIRSAPAILRWHLRYSRNEIVWRSCRTTLDAVITEVMRLTSGILSSRPERANKAQDKDRTKQKCTRTYS